jgi:hypothetical protein
MLSGKGQNTRLSSSHNATYGSSTLTLSSATPRTDTRTDTVSIPATNHSNHSNHFPKPKETYLQIYGDRKRFATAFLCWLLGGLFGAHHFYLRGFRRRFSWIYSVTSLLSFGTSLLLYLYKVHECTNDFCEKNSDETTVVFCKLVFRIAILGIPIFTPILRWVIEVQRLPRMVQRANAPTSLQSNMSPLNTADAYSMSFSGVCLGAHWLYLRPIESNTWNHGGTEAMHDNEQLWSYGVLRFLLMFITGGGFGFWWLYDLFRMPVHVDMLLGRRRNDRHVYRPSALLLVVIGFWCGLHNFYLFGTRSRYAKLYGISGVLSSVLIATYLSTVHYVDTGVCYNAFHNVTQPGSGSNATLMYDSARSAHDVMRSVSVENGNGAIEDIPSGDDHHSFDWRLMGVCWCWRLFFWLQILAMFLRLLIDMVRIGLLGLHQELNSDLQDREDTLARQVSYVNAYLLCLPVGIVGTHRIFLYGMTTSTFFYIVTCGGFGLAWIYDILDIPRLIDDQFTAARRALFHAPSAGAVAAASTAAGDRRQSSTYSGSLASSPYGPAPPPASWRDHLVEGLAQTLHEASEGSSSKKSTSTSSSSQRGSGNESFLGTSLKGTLARGSSRRRRSLLESKSVGNVTNAGAVVGERLRTIDRTTIDHSEQVQQNIATTLSTNEEKNDPLRTPLRSGNQRAGAGVSGNNRTPVPLSSNSMTADNYNTAALMKTPQRTTVAVDITSLGPPPSTPIHRIVRVLSVKHIHSPTCHPMSESLKATSLFSSMSGMQHHPNVSGRFSPQSEAAQLSRRSSRISDVDMYFSPEELSNGGSGRSKGFSSLHRYSNSSMIEDVEGGSSGKSTTSKTLSNIWLIEFDLIQLGKKIAAGGSGQLFEARYVGTDVAVKELFTALIDSENIEEFKREVSLYCIEWSCFVL